LRCPVFSELTLFYLRPKVLETRIWKCTRRTHAEQPAATNGEFKYESLEPTARAVEIFAKMGIRNGVFAKPSSRAVRSLAVECSIENMK
jgi:hypothetical protein